MDCNNISFSGLEFEDVMALVVNCGPTVLDNWMDPFRPREDNEPQLTPAQEVEIAQIQRELAAAKAKASRNQALIALAIVGGVVVFSR